MFLASFGLIRFLSDKPYATFDAKTPRRKKSPSIFFFLCVFAPLRQGPGRQGLETYTTASTAQQPSPALATITGFKSRLVTPACSSSISSPTATAARATASTSRGGSPRTPVSTGAIRRREI